MKRSVAFFTAAALVAITSSRGGAAASSDDAYTLQTRAADAQLGAALQVVSQMLDRAPARMDGTTRATLDGALERLEAMETSDPIKSGIDGVRRTLRSSDVAIVDARALEATMDAAYRALPPPRRATLTAALGVAQVWYDAVYLRSRNEDLDMRGALANFDALDPLNPSLREERLALKDLPPAAYDAVAALARRMLTQIGAPATPLAAPSETALFVLRVPTEAAASPSPAPESDGDAAPQAESLAANHVPPGDFIEVIRGDGSRDAYNTVVAHTQLGPKLYCMKSASFEAIPSRVISLEARPGVRLGDIAQRVARACDLLQQKVLVQTAGYAEPAFTLMRLAGLVPHLGTAPDPSSSASPAAATSPAPMPAPVAS